MTGGHGAVHVEERLGKGVGDPAVAVHARENDYVVLTNDTDFLRPEGRQGCKVLYCPDNTKRASEIVALIDDLSSIIPEQADLPTVTWVTDELSP